MRYGLMKEFGARLRARIKTAGFSSVSRLLAGLRINHGLITALVRGDQTDVGLSKVAEIAIMLGKRPSEIVAELDDILLNPPALRPDEFSLLAIPGQPEDYDAWRLALIADVVEGWDQQTRAAAEPAELGPLIADFYEALVRPEPTVTTLDLRRRVMAQLFAVQLPEPAAQPRGRGRPATAGAN